MPTYAEIEAHRKADYVNEDFLFGSEFFLIFTSSPSTYSYDLNFSVTERNMYKSLTNKLKESSINETDFKRGFLTAARTGQFDIEASVSLYNTLLHMCELSK
ncbi:hypothetical protein ACQKND_16420 [Viridibacillus arvi]|uniref:hypothetical protein n=1 Tax=Viridibacillus arvi TaxID=263475 RepID=UPI003D04D332